jgi:hypothetical protein
MHEHARRYTELRCKKILQVIATRGCRKQEILVRGSKGGNSYILQHAIHTIVYTNTKTRTYTKKLRPGGTPGSVRQPSHPQYRIGFPEASWSRAGSAIVLGPCSTPSHLRLARGQSITARRGALQRDRIRHSRSTYACRRNSRTSWPALTR